ncbi:MAG: prephenate dehydrogenase [Lachnospiraceae bacterium]|nr:prephenate dehydrogenase [Lachnospiraceae bacterium]
MKVGIVGLGLIGGSFAKAYHAAGHTVAAFDTNATIFSFAKLDGAVSEELTDETIPGCDLILICTYPEAAVHYMEEKGPVFGKNPVVIDCCGTKGNIVDRGFALAEKYGFTYIGGHPMAGTQFSGFKYSRGDLYVGAPMVLVPSKNDDITFLDRVKTLLKPAGFGSITVTTAETHDKVIAFSSQLAHVVSNAYVKSETAKIHTGMSAGSYKDLTRVAWLNPEMWTQLFFDNKENLISEIDTLMAHMKEYRDALETDDRETMKRLLDEGRRRKEEVDGK